MRARHGRESGNPAEKVDMNARKSLATLKTPGQPQTAAISRRHGSGGNVFGVPTSNASKRKRCP